MSLSKEKYSEDLAKDEDSKTSGKVERVRVKNLLIDEGQLMQKR